MGEYSKTMTITLKNMKAFISKHGTGDTDEWLNDKQDVYEITSENNIIPKGIDTFTGLENTYKIQRLRSLSANYESVYEKNEKSVKEFLERKNSDEKLNIVELINKIILKEYDLSRLNDVEKIIQIEKTYSYIMRLGYKKVARMYS